jgi:hypothetical protein
MNRGQGVRIETPGSMDRRPRPHHPSTTERATCGALVADVRHGSTRVHQEAGTTWCSPCSRGRELAQAAYSALGDADTERERSDRRHSGFSAPSTLTEPTEDEQGASAGFSASLGRVQVRPLRSCSRDTPEVSWVSSPIVLGSLRRGSLARSSFDDCRGAVASMCNALSPDAGACTWGEKVSVDLAN